MKLLCRLNPVTQASLTVVNEDGSQVENRIAMMSEFYTTLYGLVAKYNLYDDVYFSGPLSFVNGVAKITETESLTKFENHQGIKVHIL